ncbi:MAG: SCO family protein [Myxococcales bacterium]|nr:SCO family protein [Myxococcales bacterium]
MSEHETDGKLPEGARIVDGEVRYAKPPPGLKRPWYFNPFLWAAVAGMLTIPMLRQCTRRVPDPPPPIRQLPAYTLIDQDGKAFGSKDLAGHVYVVNFFFKSCTTVCPPLMRAMAELQTEIERLKVDVRLVSITVDPENDTPEKLREVAKTYGVKPGRWTLLTAKTPKVIHELAVKGFLQHMGTPPAKGKHPVSHGAAMSIAHSASMILVDQHNRIRGYYKRDKQWGIQEIAHRAVQTILKPGDK